MTPSQKKALDWWARDFGYNDFDTYIRSGGSVDDAAQNIRQRINTLLDALHAITGKLGVEDTPKPEPIEPGHVDEPVDPANAQLQGAEFDEH